MRIGPTTGHARLEPVRVAILWLTWRLYTAGDCGVGVPQFILGALLSARFGARVSQGQLRQHLGNLLVDGYVTREPGAPHYATGTDVIGVTDAGRDFLLAWIGQHGMPVLAPREAVAPAEQNGYGS